MDAPSSYRVRLHRMRLRGIGFAEAVGRTPQALESLRGPLGGGDVDAVVTGVESWKLTDCAVLAERTAHIRTLDVAPLSRHDVRDLIACDVTGLAELADDERVSDGELCERCLALRGQPLSEIRIRRLARERARIWLFLASKPEVPSTEEELLRLYEVANADEPHFCATFPARLRTKDDPIPFTLHWNHIDRVPLEPGFETLSGSQIPKAVEALLDFAARTDIACEWVAFTSYFLVGRIHPFRDGNGHLARMLTIALLARRYSAERLLALVASMQKHRGELVQLQSDVQLGKAELTDIVGYLLDLLAGDAC